MAEGNENKDSKIIIDTPPPKPQVIRPKPEFLEEEAGHLDPKKEDPGMMESYGSFPVWMLKGIQMLTPDILVQKSPTKKKYRV
ncbi:hypothetical protein [Nitrospina watsonii]|uniref:Uncharacterized protein n=1 Tax=Nitrospina watsonii TaxID=1323948 RepID=A0ABM9HB39_9BACT|nr:hypothetical protein [Nitrospina watsonii]CAI2717339.1 conserved protein of unknown function [Nitrospina watsonii]